MRVLPLVLVLLAACGCRGHVAKTDAVGELKADVTTPRDASPPVPREALDALLASFQRVHFDTDSAVLGPDALATLGDSAAILKAHPTIVVDVEGHADERGTFDYNLALGTARADAVRKALVGLGIDAARLRTNTWGEEKPLVDGHDEIAWAENRRAEFRVRTADGLQ